MVFFPIQSIERGLLLWGLPEKMLRQRSEALAKEAKATYKIDKVVLVNCEIFEKYLETFREY